MLSSVGLIFISSSGFSWAAAEFISVKKDKSSSDSFKLKKLDRLYKSVFSRNSDVEMKNALQDLIEKDMTGLIFDLRDNPGGLLNSAVNILDNASFSFDNKSPSITGN